MEISSPGDLLVWDTSLSSLKAMLFLLSNLGFPIIQTGSPIEIDIASLIVFLRNLTFLLNLALPYFDSIKPKELPWQLAIVTSMSCTLVANS